jgi:uncharacterized membrane protein YeaQ/YmgE (transglycosylase-associated protein family)
MGLPWFPWQGAAINFIIWCAAGAGVGWLSGVLAAGNGKVARTEDILVGIFGAFIGGEFVADQLRGKSADTFSLSSLGLAVVGAVVMLLLLKVMRGAVGPLRSRKSPTARKR